MCGCAQGGGHNSAVGKRCDFDSSVRIKRIWRKKEKGGTGEQFQSAIFPERGVYLSAAQPRQEKRSLRGVVTLKTTRVDD